MLRFTPVPKKDAPLKVLCLGAHCDDIEIGCGGTLLRLAAQQDIDCHWVVATASAEREAECRACADMLMTEAKHCQVTTWQFRDGFLPYSGAEVKDAFERLKREVSPDLIFTHFRNDLHQDHRLINSLTWNTWRDHCILEYEIPKYDGDFRSPNLYVPLGEDVCRRKVEYLMACYATQRSHAWFTPETFRAVLRLRGVEACSPTGQAEGFYARKVTL